MDNLNPQPNPSSKASWHRRPGPMPLPSPPKYTPQVSSGGLMSPPAQHILVGDDVDVKFFDFTDLSIRRSFIRKVYGLLTCQLLLTVAGITLFVYCRPVAQFSAGNKPAFYTALALYFALVLVLICVTEARRRAPLNYILLFAFTVATTYMLGTLSAMMESTAVMMAVGVTALICFSLTIFAFQTKIDFTTCSGFILSLMLALLFMGVTCSIWPNRALELVLCAGGIVIFSFSFVYNTQLMLGGEHKYTITPEEYVFAALSLYLDVINIFIRLLRLMR